jgi:hypothetical protein
MLVLMDAGYVDSAKWVRQELSSRKRRIAKVKMYDKKSDD